jgi:hypothetical protein
MEMVRITVEWNNVIPSLHVAAGVLTAHKQTWPKVNEKDKAMCFEEIFSCKVKVEQGSLSYSSLHTEGIKSLYFDLYKEKIDIMLRSYHAGTTIKEQTYFWIEDPEYYTITTLEPNKKSGIKHCRCIGLAVDKMRAIDIVSHNCGDINENGYYTYAVVERIEPGLYPAVLEAIWFKWNKNKKRYDGCTVPKEFAHMVNFGIG